MSDEIVKPSSMPQQMLMHHNEHEKQRLNDIKKRSYCDLCDLAEISENEMNFQDDECEKAEYMLEKIMKNGTYHDAVHGIHYFIDYIHANNALKCL